MPPSADRRVLALLLLILLPFLALPDIQPAQAVAGFGSGITTCPGSMQPFPLSNPTTLSSEQCTRAGIQAALNAGGQILLNCGTMTIPIDQTLHFNPQKDTLIDGSGAVTLNGLGQVRILEKGWHDAAQFPSVTIILQNIRLIRGKAPSSSDTGGNSGGALAAGYPGTRVYILNSTFSDNTTTDTHTPDNQGGAIFVHNAYELVISGSMFSNNSAGNGGAIGIIAAGVEFVNSSFTANHALDDTQGGVVRGYGGALHLDGVHNDYNPDTSRRYRVCGSDFESNTSYRGGGALSAVVSDGFNTQADIERSYFYNNYANGITDPAKASDYLYGQGGAIYHVEDDLISGANEDNFLIRSSTFAGNRARKQGGGVWVTVNGRGVFSNTTFNANATTAPLNTVGQGGGAALMSGSYQLVNTVFAANHAAYQGGGLFGGSDVTLANTIFLNNTLNQQTLPSTTQWQGYHTNRTMKDGGKNIQYPRLKPDYNNDVNNLITAAPIFQDPLLATLAANGGPTFTMALSPTSPAVNQGSPGRCPAFDQRGYTRQGACDIGAYEYGGSPFIPASWLFLPYAFR